MDTVPLLARLEKRRFDIHNKPAPVTPRYYVNDIPISTAGNLTVIAALPKHGKSAWVGAMRASTMGTGDCLGVTSANPDGKAVIHLDTEQSVQDHYLGNERVLHRVGFREAPKWFLSYCITGWPTTEARAIVPIAMEEAAQEFGGIHSIIIDGSADLVFDVNDPSEASKLVSEWHGQAIQYECASIHVIHINPSAPRSRTAKTRGHLGSQLERKAETNLKLEKDGAAILVYGEKNRKEPIPRDRGPRFVWSDEKQMFVSAQCAAELKEAAEKRELTHLAKGIFVEHPSLRRMELESAVKSRLTVGDKTAERRVSRMLALGVIKVSETGHYSLNGETE